MPDAVNVSGGPVGEEVAPWLELVRKLGLLAGTLSPEAVQKKEKELEYKQWVMFIWLQKMN